MHRAIIIFAWTAATSGALFAVLKLTMGLRVSEQVEDQGMDVSIVQTHVLSKATSASGDVGLRGHDLAAAMLILPCVCISETDGQTGR